MSYYDTIEEDLARAKAILEKGAVDGLTILPPPVGSTAAHGTSYGPNGRGHIYGADIYAAYKLLESFVEVIERLREEQYHLHAEVEWLRTLVDAVGENVCKTALRMKTRHDQSPPDDK